MENFQVMYENFLTFCKYNLAYKTLVQIGVVFQIVASCMLYVYLLEGRTSDYYLVPIVLVVLGVRYIWTVFTIANDRKTFITEVGLYEPFNQEVNDLDRIDRAANEEMIKDELHIRKGLKRKDLLEEEEEDVMEEDMLQEEERMEIDSKEELDQGFVCRRQPCSIIWEQECRNKIWRDKPH